MKRYYSILLTVLVLLSGGCSMDDNYEGQGHDNDICTVISTGDSGTQSVPTLRRDDGALLEVAKGAAGLSALTAGQRIYCTYDRISGSVSSGAAAKTYKINVVGYYKILTKPLEKESALQAGQTAGEKFGNNIICARHASIGDNHLNVEFIYRRGEKSTSPHRITLVWEDGAEADEVVLRLYHNAYDDIFKEGNRLREVTGLISVPIEEVMPEGKTKVTLKICYTWEKGEEFGTIPYELNKLTYSSAIDQSSIGNNLIRSPMNDYIR